MCTFRHTFHVLLLTCVGCLSHFVQPILSEDSVVDFNNDVRPILAEHCLHCHGPDAEQRAADLRLDTPESMFELRDGYHVVDRDQPQKSELLVRVSSRDADLQMPPVDSPSQPTTAEIDTLRRWIQQGAEWNEHWSFVAPRRIALPIVDRKNDHQSRSHDWSGNPIDRFVLQRLNRESRSPASEADRYTLIRRASLSLTGLPPTPAEVDAFVQDVSPDAYERVVDRLLDSPSYGEHMAAAWLDAARYADTSGYQADWERFMWPWRDWVVQAMNDNMPFDQFTVEQLAGDMLPNPSRSQQLATGFNRNHRINDEGGSLAAEFEVEYVVDRVDTTATIWLGLTAGCARCHDHKYDPISQREFYQLYAYFNNVPEKGIDGRKGFAVPHIEIPNPFVQRELARLQVSLARLQDDKAASNATQSLVDQIKKLQPKANTPVMVMQELPERKPTYLLKRGQYDQPVKGEVIEPRLPTVFQASVTASGLAKPTNRLELARWLVSSQNPLTARVTVNRIWQHHFGVGLVKTAEDFGTRGERPSHPELLDWLATEFMRTQWDVKALHRLITKSATFRQSSHVNKQQRQQDENQDPENRLLARGPRLRLTGAAIRDQALDIAGLLDQTIGGPTVKPYQPPGLWKELSFGTGKTTVDFYVQDHGISLYRRGLYTFWKRTVAPPRMAVFDGGGREMCRVRSDRTNTPLQALTLQNDVTFVEAARHLAERMLLQVEKQSNTSADAGLIYAWRMAVTRSPTADELNVLQAARDRYLSVFAAQPDEAAALLAYGESARDTKLDAVTHAAHTLVALSILNLDETITRE